MLNEETETIVLNLSRHVKEIRREESEALNEFPRAALPQIPFEDRLTPVGIVTDLPSNAV